MAAPKGRSLFPPDPYFIPGYQGFVPQYNYQFGETYGKTTARLLTDPRVRKSRHSLLAPLHEQKFVEDLSRTKDNVQGCLPGCPGYFPYEEAEAGTGFPEPVVEPKPPPGPGPAEEELMMTHTVPVSPYHPGEYVSRTQLPRGYPWETSRHPASEEQELRLPRLTPACGQGRWSGPGPFSRACARSNLPVTIEDVTLPGVAETMDVEQDNRLPKLAVPKAIQQKATPGYTGFIPRLSWTMGVNYICAVKEAMEEFDRHQVLQRSPVSSIGKRFHQTYWPDNKIYTSAGLIPFYTGFVPQVFSCVGLKAGTNLFYSQTDFHCPKSQQLKHNFNYSNQFDSGRRNLFLRQKKIKPKSIKIKEMEQNFCSRKASSYIPMSCPAIQLDRCGTLDIRHTYALTFGNGTRKAYQKEQRRRARAL